MMSFPRRTSSFTSARTTKAFSVPRFSVRRLMRGMGGRSGGCKGRYFSLCGGAFRVLSLRRIRGTRMLINCAAYQDGKKLGDIAPEDIGKYVSRPECFVWVAMKDPGPG